MAVSITVPVMSENDATAARLRGSLSEHAACSVAKGRSPRYHSANALIEFSGIRNVHISRIDLNLLAIFDISVSSPRRELRAEDFELARHDLRRRIRLRFQS